MAVAGSGWFSFATRDEDDPDPASEDGVMLDQVILARARGRNRRPVLSATDTRSPRDNEGRAFPGGDSCDCLR